MNNKLKTLVQALMEETNEIRGVKDAHPPDTEWWMLIDWKTPAYKELFGSLGDETREMITDAGLCPECGEKALGMDMSLEEINAKLDELKKKRDAIRESMRAVEDKLYSETPEEKKQKAGLRDQINQFWDEISDINDEIYAYSNAKTIKITEGALNDAASKVVKPKKVPVKPKKTEDVLDPHEVLNRASQALEK